ncbi:hypothetical protein FG379_002165 [Cryptosporidium bovis]|uniref:uncharacterized protein n=1 Tax=Cryptosporidium bovis TaxID=310047 RepID=UPI003519FC01|nr:hypothetical protein FG379_002165 [Cryptosporidium bovis]
MNLFNIAFNVNITYLLIIPVIQYRYCNVIGDNIRKNTSIFEISMAEIPGSSEQPSTSNPSNNEASCRKVESRGRKKCEKKSQGRSRSRTRSRSRSSSSSRTKSYTSNQDSTPGGHKPSKGKYPNLKILQQPSGRIGVSSKGPNTERVYVYSSSGFYQCTQPHAPCHFTSGNDKLVCEKIKQVENFKESCNNISASNKNLFNILIEKCSLFLEDGLKGLDLEELTELLSELWISLVGQKFLEEVDKIPGFLSRNSIDQIATSSSVNLEKIYDECIKVIITIINNIASFLEKKEKVRELKKEIEILKQID